MPLPVRDTPQVGKNPRATQVGNLRLHQHERGGLDELLEFAEVICTDCAVHDAVVRAERDAQALADDDGVVGTDSGFFTIAPMARMSAWGGLMIAQN